MKWIKLFEDFKQNNIEGNLITPEDVRNCIKSNGRIFSTAFNDLPETHEYYENSQKEGLRPVSIDDEDNQVTAEFADESDNSQYTVDLKDIKKIEW
jgi:hypothetical protein